MANFMSQSACHGARPKQVDLNNKILRENLINKLMSQRSVLRYINAPNGYGKSILACQYADLVFSFKDVFWINCQSPCFIRDLDSKVIASQIVQISKKQNLVVFDDVCILDENRILDFSQLIDELLEYDIEVIVTSTIFSNSLLKYQKDALVLNCEDMMLSSSEMVMTEGLDYAINENITRIPCVAWDEEGIYKILELSLNEEFPDSIKFSLFCIYLFKCQSLQILDKYISKSEYKLLIDVNKNYGYFGIDEETRNFDVPEISIKDLFSIFVSYKEIIMTKFGSKTNVDLFKNLSMILENCNQIDRAIELCEYLCSKEIQKKYLEKWNEISIRKSYLLRASSLFRNVYRKNFVADINTVYQALRMAILGFSNDAIRLSYGILDSKVSTIDNKLFAALIFMRFGEFEEKNQAIKIIRYLKSDFKIETYLKNSDLSDYEKNKCITISEVLDIYLAVFSENINPFSVWLNYCTDNLENNDLIAAECLLNSISIVRNEHIRTSQCQQFLNAISRNLNYALNSDFNFYSYALVKSYLKAQDEISEKSGVVAWEASETLLAKYNEYSALLKFEQNNYIRIHKSDLSLVKEYSLKDIETFKKIGVNYKSLFQKVKKPNYDVPKLRINIFGGLTAYIDGKEIIKTSFGRQNIKLICCILTLENGQEINKDKIASIIWPDSDDEQKRINMNTHWSTFRKYLTLPNGHCPYLVRSQNSYKLNKDYFTSDLQIFNSLCSELTMGSLDSQTWFEKFKENENILNGDLLPSETKNVYIKNKRKEFTTMLINALVAASERLIDAGELQQALWFANKAYLRDNTREDVYSALMRAQMFAGQRTPAIETYFACKKFLNDQLNMKPSAIMNNMYKKVLNESKL